MDIEDSTVPVGGDDEPYVKIEPLKHKKAFTSVDPEPEAKNDDAETEETEAMCLPPLIGGAGKGSVTETESSKTSRASSGVDDSELSYNSSDNEGVPAAPLVSEAAIKCEPEASGPPNVRPVAIGYCQSIDLVVVKLWSHTVIDYTVGPQSRLV